MALVFTSCKKADVANLQEVEMNNQQWFNNWKRENPFKNEIASRNFERNTSLFWDKQINSGNKVFVPAAINTLLKNDSVKLFKFFSFTQNGRQIIEPKMVWFLMPEDVEPANSNMLLSESWQKNQGNKLSRLEIALQEKDRLNIPSTNDIPLNGSTIRVNKSNKVSTSNNAPLDEGCEIEAIDWYWQTFVNGVLVYEEYLFTTNEIVCEGGGSGGGGISGDTTGLANPCDSVALLAANTEFKEKMATLKTKANGNKEYSYYYRNTTTNTFEETEKIGSENVLQNEFTLPSYQIDGIMHNHFFVEGKSVSIFSWDDIYAIIKCYADDKMSDPYTFTSILATQHGNQYMLKIDDLTAFNEFAKKYINYDDWNLLQQTFTIQKDHVGENWVSQNELNFLKQLQFSKSGLKFFKANPNMSSWQPFKHANLQIVNDPCN